MCRLRVRSVVPAATEPPQYLGRENSGRVLILPFFPFVGEVTVACRLDK